MNFRKPKFDIKAKQIIAIVLSVLLLASPFVFADKKDAEINKPLGLSADSGGDDVNLGKSDIIDNEDELDENSEEVVPEEEPEILMQTPMLQPAPKNGKTRHYNLPYPSPLHGHAMSGSMDITGDLHIGQMPKPDYPGFDSSILGELGSFWQNHAALVVNPTTATFNLNLKNVGGIFPRYCTVTAVTINMHKPNEDFTNWTKLDGQNIILNEKNSSSYYSKTFNLETLFPRLKTEPGPYALSVAFRLDRPTGTGNTDIFTTNIIVNPEFIVPKIELIGANGIKDPNSIELNMSAYLIDQDPSVVEKYWTLKSTDSGTVNYDSNSFSDINDALKLLDRGTYQIQYTGSAMSNLGYEISSTATQDFEITVRPPFKMEITLELEGGFIRDGIHYNPTMLNIDVQSVGLGPAGSNFQAYFINYDDGTTELTANLGGSPPNTDIEKLLEYQGIKNGNVGIRWEFTDYLGNKYAEATADFTAFDSQPVINTDRLFNPKNADIENIYFNDSPDDYYYWKITSESGDIKADDNTKNIPTNIFALLPSETGASTRYKIEFTEKYAEGFSDSADPVYITVKRPQPSFAVDGIVTPTNIENPSVIDIIPDIQIDNLTDPDDISQYSWEITSSLLPSPITGNGKQIPSETLSVLDSGDYNVTIYQQFMPYQYGVMEGTGSVSFAFTVKRKASLTVAKHIDFGQHKIADKMTIPWEKVDGKTGSDFTNGKVPLAEIKAGAVPITGVRLSSTPITNVNDSTNKINGAMHWGELNKSNNSLTHELLEGNGYYIVDQNVGIAPGATETVYCTDDSNSLDGIYFMTESGDVPDLLVSEYSATLTWTIEYIPKPNP